MSVSTAIVFGATITLVAYVIWQMSKIHNIIVVSKVAEFDKLEEIHMLVNNRLSEALDEIKRLGGKRDEF